MILYTKKLSNGWSENDLAPILKEYQKTYKDAKLAIDHCTKDEIAFALRTGPGGQKLESYPKMIKVAGFDFSQNGSFIVARKQEKQPVKIEGTPKFTPKTKSKPAKETKEEKQEES